MLLTAKALAIFFGLATTAFCVATIVLAVQKTNLENDLQDAQNKLDKVTTPAPQQSTSTSATPAETTPTAAGTNTTPSGTETTPSKSPNPNESTTTPNGMITTTKATTLFPNEPTLPPGLTDPEKIIYRLPTDLRPIKYRLYFHPNLTTHTSENTVSIQVEVEKETNLIAMHAKDIEIDGISILNMMVRMRMRIRKSYLSAERELLIIELEEMLRKSMPYVVSISYRSMLSGTAGMYASSYKDAQGENK